ncbi:hypothetical protein NQZ68_038471 [Dissostichus eleginoides]|nr:hypothetical protein NQZ68_038471 [Dissostichus eleginoides]
MLVELHHLSLTGFLTDEEEFPPHLKLSISLFPKTQFIRSDAGRHRTDEQRYMKHEGVSIDLKDIQKVRHHNRSTRNLQRTFEPANLQDGNH